MVELGGLLSIFREHRWDIMLIIVSVISLFVGSGLCAPITRDGLFIDDPGGTKTLRKDVGIHKPDSPSLQPVYGLPKFGFADGSTKDHMLTRCGVKDSHNSRRKRQILYRAARWGKHQLTYAIYKGNEELGMAKTKIILRRAFNLWQNVAELDIREVSPTGREDISIHFVRGDHVSEVGLPYFMERPFDGPGGVHAHSFYPNVGDVHFDEDEEFTDGTYVGVNLFQIAAHELGHSLGLKHSSNNDSVMASVYRGYDPNFKLHTEDIARIQALYGKRLHTFPFDPSKQSVVSRASGGMKSTTISIGPQKTTTFIPYRRKEVILKSTVNKTIGNEREGNNSTVMITKSTTFTPWRGDTKQVTLSTSTTSEISNETEANGSTTLTSSPRRTIFIPWRMKDYEASFPSSTPSTITAERGSSNSATRTMGPARTSFIPWRPDTLREITRIPTPGAKATTTLTSRYQRNEMPSTTTPRKLTTSFTLRPMPTKLRLRGLM